MQNLYGSGTMASGYARWRPPVHSRVIEKIRERLAITGKVPRALDVGCGSGLSTAPLALIAERCFGVEPVEAMLRWAHIAAPHAAMAVASAEQLPVAGNTVDIITAAGSLNYVDLQRFFPEARRVLVKGGHLVIYDFGPGRRFPHSAALGDWYDEFEHRYPFPPCRDLQPADFDAARCGFQQHDSERFQVSLKLAPEFYLEYVLTETSVAQAIRRGTPEEEIRAWCAGTLSNVFEGLARDVVFTGYIAYLNGPLT